MIRRVVDKGVRVLEITTYEVQITPAPNHIADFKFIPVLAALSRKGQFENRNLEHGTKVKEYAGCPPYVSITGRRRSSVVKIAKILIDECRLQGLKIV